MELAPGSLFAVTINTCLMVTSFLLLLILYCSSNLKAHSTFHLPDHVTVQIHIGDVNDNQPLFDNQSYSFAIAENAGSGAIVGQVKATDTDQVSNRGTLSYVGDKCSPSLITCRVFSFQVHVLTKF